MQTNWSSVVAKQRKIRRARTRSNSSSQSPLHTISGLGLCRSPGLSTSIDSGYDSDTCPSAFDSPAKLRKCDTSPDSAKLPSNSAQPSSPAETNSTVTDQNSSRASNAASTSTTTSDSRLLKVVERRRKRKFRKSQSDQLLRAVLKRAQKKVNKQIIKTQSSTKLQQQQQQQQKPSSESKIAGVNPADYKDLKYVAPSSIEQLVRKSLSTSGSASQQFTLIDCRTPGEFRSEHIQGAINIFNKEAMFRFYTMQLAVSPKDLSTSLIFYSNHVLNESLKMAYFLRALDLRTNNSKHSKLLFPKIYIVNDNFNNFRTQLSGVMTSNSQ